MPTVLVPEIFEHDPGFLSTVTSPFYVHFVQNTGEYDITKNTADHVCSHQGARPGVRY